MTRRAYRGERLPELAWALIHDATGDRQLADDWYLDLSSEIVSRLPSNEFELRAGDIVNWLEASPLHPSDSWPGAAIEQDA
jgi:Family of unknown function (DUF6166)